MKTHRSVGPLLPGVLAPTAIHFHVDVVYYMKKVFHDGNAFVGRFAAQVQLFALIEKSIIIS